MRAKRDKLGFDLSVGDVVIPEKCPVFGTPFVKGNHKDHRVSPSLDRIDPMFGYVKSNVWVISHRANLIKNNATLNELRALVSALEQRQ